MGVSVPISTDYYKSLKEISDRLGLGLKRTVEFLVLYYLEREMTKVSIEKEIPHPPNETKIQKTSSTKISDTSTRIMDVTSTPWLESKPVAVENQYTIKPEKFIKQFTESPDRFCSSCGFSRKPNAKFCHNCGISL